MTAEQLERLPTMLREIVAIDRRMAGPIVELDDIRTRRQLRKAAEAVYGYRLAGEDNTQRSS